ncbi:MAG: beta-ketoacyl-ACP synthase II [Actinomycetota bacterium]|jgi:3-oxoacyl-[acyl-carrier-protein] synthase II|nr:beta-ketoacyl-ACP synthase II [Actinomycetota bacterium]
MKLSWGPSGPSDGIEAPHKVAITGIGAVSCVGVGKDAFWDGISQAEVTGDRHIVDFDPSKWLNPKEIRRTDRFNQFGIAAADLALADAGEFEVDPELAGIMMGTGIGGLESLENQVILQYEKGASRVSPFLVPLMMANAGSASLSMRYGYRGPCESTVTACAAGTHAIIRAAHTIASGRCKVMLAGGTEAAMTSTAYAGFVNMTAMSNANISRPFDKDRDGFVMTEGGAVLVLEELEFAKARGARIYGIIAGTASNADAYHITAPAPHGVGAATCMSLAIQDAGMSPEDIVHINAHGTSTPLNDLSESEAIITVFGDDAPPTTSIKGALGHALGGAGALGAAAAALTLEKGYIVPTANTKNVDPEIHIDVVTVEPRKISMGPVISNSFGFGGHNGSIVMVPPE